MKEVGQYPLIKTSITTKIIITKELNLKIMRLYRTKEKIESHVNGTPLNSYSFGSIRHCNDLLSIKCLHNNIKQPGVITLFALTKTHSLLRPNLSSY